MMVATQDQAGQPSAPRRRGAGPARVIGGFAVMFLGVALTSYGVHFLAKTGNCSGTGYSSYGPVPRCSGSEALYIISAFFVGPVAAIGGWLTAKAWGWLWPTFCIGAGAALITIHNESSASAGARAFGLLAGSCLFGLSGFSVLVSLRKRHGPPKLPEAAGPGSTIQAGTTALTWPVPPGGEATTADRSDPLDKIAKLAQLRDTGALTDDEFEIQKAKLLAEI